VFPEIEMKEEVSQLQLWNYPVINLRIKTLRGIFKYSRTRYPWRRTEK
jgi:hypothetical protein